MKGVGEEGLLFYCLGTGGSRKEERNGCWKRRQQRRVRGGAATSWKRMGKGGGKDGWMDLATIAPEKKKSYNLSCSIIVPIFSTSFSSLLSSSSALPSRSESISFRQPRSSSLSFAPNFLPLGHNRLSTGVRKYGRRKRELFDSEYLHSVLSKGKREGLHRRSVFPFYAQYAICPLIYMRAFQSDTLSLSPDTPTTPSPLFLSPPLCLFLKNLPPSSSFSVSFWWAMTANSCLVSTDSHTTSHALLKSKCVSVRPSVPLSCHPTLLCLFPLFFPFLFSFFFRRLPSCPPPSPGSPSSSFQSCRVKLAKGHNNLI